MSTTTSETPEKTAARPRMLTRYREEIVPALQEQFNYANAMTVPRLTKVVNQGGRAGTTGGIVTQEAAIHVSNVMLLVDAPKGSESKGKVTTRIGYRRDEVTKRRSDGSTYPAQRSTRVSRASGEEI